MTFPDRPYFSLEDPDIRRADEADPRGFLAQQEKGGFPDEIQRLPVLLSHVRGMADKTRKRGRFILTGSHQPQLHVAVNLSLAGRTTMLELRPFSCGEIRRCASRRDPFDLIRRGFSPSSTKRPCSLAGSSTATCRPTSSGMSVP